LTRNADIFELADGGHPQRAIANICGISQKQVSKILQRRADTLANARVSLIPKSIPLGDTYPQVSPQVSPEVSPPSETKNANDNNDDTLANAEVSPPNILKESTSFSLSKEVLTGEERYDSRDIGHSQEIGGLESDDTLYSMMRIAGSAVTNPPTPRTCVRSIGLAFSKRFDGSLHLLRRSSPSIASRSRN
jgi:hypothetical protein